MRSGAACRGHPSPAETDGAAELARQRSRRALCGRQRMTRGNWPRMIRLQSARACRSTSRPRKQPPGRWSPRAAESGRNDHEGVTTMNCQDRLYRKIDPTQISRRWFFEQCGVGLGAMALAKLLARVGAAATAPADPLAPKQPPLPRRRRRRHLPVHGRRAEPSGDCSTTSRSWRSSTARCRRRAAEGLPRGVHQSRTRSCSGPKFKFAKYGQSGRRSCPSCCRIWRRSSTTSRS